MSSMAARAEMVQNSSSQEVEPLADPVQLTAAELFGRGLTRHEVARKLEYHLLTPLQRKYNPRKRRMVALKKLRRWLKRKEFRDLAWANAVERLDERTPAILNGLAHRAELGRVDAAKLGLEVAGRYTPKSQDQPTAVQIVVSVPRPVVEEVIEGEAVEVDEEAI
jgi:hypothetical protein